MKSLAIFATLLAGCAPVAEMTCTPECGTGFQCVEGACVADKGAPDAGGLGVDMAIGCSPACSGITPYCNATKHCVACLEDSQCPKGTYCKVMTDAISVCTSGCNDDSRCAAGQACCDARCVDTATDLANCGACGKGCMVDHAEAMCVASTCQAGACGKGWGDCNKDMKDGCEANLHADIANCTACGNACTLAHAVAACSDGCYLSACDFGYDDCNNNEADGCETNVAGDANNCGGCGVPCKGYPNAKAACSNGQCLLGACNQGWTDCDGDAKNGCESNLMFDGKNCGMCGNVCGQQAPACNNGKCEAGLAGLVAYWKFDGNTNDSVGNKTLTISQGGQLPGFMPGKIGQATNSPMGDPQNMMLSPLPPDINNNADFTIAFWARNNTHAWYDSYALWDTGGLIIYRHGPRQWRWIVNTTDVNGQGKDLDSGVMVSGPDSPTWYHIVVYRSGNTLGIKVNNAAAATMNVGMLKVSPQLYVARMASGYSWPGQIDELGYWNRALTQGEMDVIYNNGDGRTFP